MGIEKNGNWEEWKLGSGGTEEKVDLNILCLVYNFIPNTK